MIPIVSSSFRRLEECYRAKHDFQEKEQLLRFVRSAAASYGDPSQVEIVEIGCGLGANMKALTEAGYTKVLGVDINPTLVALNIENGLACVQADSFQAQNVDIMIMAHVIEHLQPADLKVFLDRYLSALKPNGVLIISTPLIWEGFYQDFDHIKPYYPKGILAVFGKKSEQIAYYGRTGLQLDGIPWVRKIPYLISGHKYFLMQPFNRFERLVQLGLNILFYKSQRMIGKPNGWMAAFRKLPD